MKNKKPEACSLDPEEFLLYYNAYEMDKYLEELLSGLKKAHEMGQIKGDWSDTQCDNFFTVLIKETQALAKEIGWDNDK